MIFDLDISISGIKGSSLFYFIFCIRLHGEDCCDLLNLRQAITLFSVAFYS